MATRTGTKAGHGGSTRQAEEPHRVVVIGAGFGGLAAARELRSRAVEVTLVDRAPHHLFQPLLYQVATGILSEGEITPPTREVFHRRRNVRVLLGEVSHIDLDAREVTSETSQTVTVTPYDSLVVAAGAGHSYFGHDEFARHAPGLKTIADALELRSRIYGAFEVAEALTDEAVRREWLTFVVVGAGPTGVEMAGQLVELARRSLRGNYRSFDPRTVRVLLLEAGPRVLPGFHPRLSRVTATDLERLGVEVHLDTRVVGVDETGVDVVDGHGTRRRFTARTKVWAAGVRVSALAGPLATATGTERNHAGQLAVLDDCTLPGHPEVFVVGDMIGVGVPGVAQVALQSGRFAARTILHRLEDPGHAARFTYRDKGMLATIARFRAVAQIGRLRFSGVPAWLLWLAVHLVTLVCFKNRALVLAHWLISFLGRGRAERTAPLEWLRRTSGAVPVEEAAVRPADGDPARSVGQWSPLVLDADPVLGREVVEDPVTTEPSEA